MAMYAYVKEKAKPFRLHESQVKKPKNKKRFRVLSGIFFILGVILIGQVVYPIVGWYLFVLPSVGTGVASPLASTFRPENSPLFPALVSASETISGQNGFDSNQPSTWFVGGKAVTKVIRSNIKNYQLSIPKLSINDAKVVLGGDNLKQELVAWETSVTPGQFGNVIIFGHSSLPQLSSPKSYASMFTHLMDLKEGDEIIVHYDGSNFTYKVVNSKIVAPTDLSVLEQRFDAPYITLVTCEPPGTLWMRGIVQARLENY